MILLQDIIKSNHHWQPAWLLLLIVLSVMLTGYLFSAFNTRFMAVIKSFFTARFASELAREEYSLTHPVSVLLSVNYLLTASLFILQVLAAKNIFPSHIDFSILSLLLIIGCLFLVYFIKVLSVAIVAFIYDKQQLAHEYTFNIFLVNQMAGIGFIPVIIFIAYGNSWLANLFIYIGLILMISAFVIRLWKGVIAAFSGSGTTLFYLFLYLCTLEILPLLIAIKLFEKLA